jgi:hypothetical protein
VLETQAAALSAAAEAALDVQRRARGMPETLLARAGASEPRCVLSGSLGYHSHLHSRHDGLLFFFSAPPLYNRLGEIYSVQFKLTQSKYTPAVRSGSLPRHARAMPSATRHCAKRRRGLRRDAGSRR